MKRLGTVQIKIGHTVDLDNEPMIEEAEDFLIEDIYNAVKFNTVNLMVKTLVTGNEKEEDIASFL